MKTKSTAPRTIDDYIAGFPAPVQQRLQQMRATIREAAPDAVETIAYHLPTFVLNGNLVHFGAFEEHIGFYATPSGHTQFKKELAAYEGAKGSVKFPFDCPMPLSLVRRIVQFRAQENRKKTKTVR